MSENDFLTANYEPWKIKVWNQLSVIANRLHEKDSTRKDENGYVGKPSLYNSYICDSVEGKRHFIIFPSSNLFDRLIMREELLRIVTGISPKCFGTNDAMDVLLALWKHIDYCQMFDFERFRKFIQHEQFAWVVEYNGDGMVGDRILRLDLYRKLDEREDGGYDFTGGLMHVFKHFSFNGYPISYLKSGNEVPDLRYILRMIIEAFFMVELMDDIKRGKRKYIGSIDFKGKKMDAVFYNNEEAGVWFIDSFHE